MWQTRRNPKSNCSLGRFRPGELIHADEYPVNTAGIKNKQAG
jgi:hypothetical protein